jgi:phosphatidylserine synthase
MTHTVGDVRVVSAFQSILCGCSAIRHLWVLLLVFNSVVLAITAALMFRNLRGKRASDLPPAPPRATSVLMVLMLVVTFFVGLWVDGFTWLSLVIIATLVFLFVRTRQLGRLGTSGATS